jgi:hypothetical protein
MNSIEDRRGRLHQRVESVCLLLGPVEPSLQLRTGFNRLLLVCELLSVCDQELAKRVCPFPVLTHLEQVINAFLFLADLGLELFVCIDTLLLLTT